MGGEKDISDQSRFRLRTEEEMPMAAKLDDAGPIRIVHASVQREAGLDGKEIIVVTSTIVVSKDAKPIVRVEHLSDGQLTHEEKALFENEPKIAMVQEKRRFGRRPILFAGGALLATAAAEYFRIGYDHSEYPDEGLSVAPEAEISLSKIEDQKVQNLLNEYKIPDASFLKLRFAPQDMDAIEEITIYVEDQVDNTADSAAVSMGKITINNETFKDTQLRKISDLIAFQRKLNITKEDNTLIIALINEEQFMALYAQNYQRGAVVELATLFRSGVFIKMEGNFDPKVGNSTIISGHITSDYNGQKFRQTDHVKEYKVSTLFGDRIKYNQIFKIND